MDGKVKSYYQEIANLIIEMIPEDWKEIKFYVSESSEGARARFFYYRSSETDEWIYNMMITEKFHYPEEKFEKLDDELFLCISNFKKAYQEEFGEAWNSFQLNLDKNGKFKIYVDYNKNPFDPLLTHLAWKYEHFGIIPDEGTFYRDSLNEYLEEKAQGKHYPFLEPKMGQQ